MKRYPPRSLACSRIINALRTARGLPLSYANLIDAVWPDDLDGGPLYAKDIIRIRVLHLRRLGYPVRTYHTFGYAYAWTEWEVVAVPSLPDDPKLRFRTTPVFGLLVQP